MLIVLPLAVEIMVYSLFYILISTHISINAFSHHRPISSSVHTKLHASSPISNLFSGVLGVAPSSLTPPTDILAGTSIDPARDDVELGRVYKVSHELYLSNMFYIDMSCTLSMRIEELTCDM